MKLSIVPLLLLCACLCACEQSSPPAAAAPNDSTGDIGSIGDAEVDVAQGADTVAAKDSAGDATIDGGQGSDLGSSSGMSGGGSSTSSGGDASDAGGSSSGADVLVDTAVDAAVDTAVDTVTDTVTTCPTKAPQPGAVCSGKVTCDIGNECCCGKCSPSLVCTCQSGNWSCNYTDFCLGAQQKCPDTKLDTQQPDTAVTDVDAGDTLAKSCPGGSYCPCTSNSDCDSGFCIGEANKTYCAQPCVSACPAGFECKAVASGSGDKVSLCVVKP